MHRRSFLAASAGLAVIQKASGEPMAKQPDVEVDWRGKTRNDIPTPALLVDLEAFEANLKTLADHCKKTGCGFRPHAKTHKCPEIAKRQVKAGALGV